MKILSFDVGIKNLAYCILEVDCKDNIKILDWNIINLTEYKCTENCNENAKYKLNNEFYCENHKVDHKIDWVKCDGICNKCSRKSKFKHNNLEYCTIHSKQVEKKIQMAEINPKKFNIFDLKLNIIKHLDKYVDFMTVDLVLIESQPVRVNPIMKMAADSLYFYFMLRGIYDKHNNSTIKDVKYMIASNKMKLIKEYQDELKKCKETQKYKLRKTMSKEYCGKYLQELKDDKYIKFYENNKKKQDDLSDSFLQCVYYIKFVHNK